MKRLFLFLAVIAGAAALAARELPSIRRELKIMRM